MDERKKGGREPDIGLLTLTAIGRYMKRRRRHIFQGCLSIAKKSARARRALFLPLLLLLLLLLLLWSRGVGGRRRPFRRESAATQRPRRKARQQPMGLASPVVMRATGKPEEEGQGKSCVREERRPGR